MTEFVRDVMAAADKLQWQRFAIAGHSMSAAIASVCASVFPERVTHLVLVDGFGPWSMEASQVAEQLRRAITTAPVLAAKQARPYASRDEAVARLLQNNPTLAPHSAQALVARGTDINDDGSAVFLHDIRLNCPSMSRYTEEQVNEFLKAYVLDRRHSHTAAWNSRRLRARIE